MKKIVSVIAMFMASSAFAGGLVGFEFEREKYSNGVYENTVKVAPGYKAANGVKYDLQFGASREDGTEKQLDNSIEARVQKLWAVGPVHIGGRVSVGEKFKTGGDFSYYTVEPKAEMPLGASGVSLLTSYRYRNAFGSGHDYKTGTTKVGVGYDLTKNAGVEVKYFQKRGDEHSNGVEFGLGFKF